MTKEIAIEHFVDRLTSRCQSVGAPVCVGIDPVYDRLPQPIVGPHRSTNSTRARQALQDIHDYVRGVLEAVAPHAACVKIQAACFERYHWQGVELYHQIIHEAKALGLLVIADAKRGDIGISAAHYAAGCLSEVSYEDLPPLHGPDALTINAYLGMDTLEPFLETACREGKGLFALVRTSNPGSDALQALALADGRTVSDAMAQMVANTGSQQRFVSPATGYSLMGAVVGATKPQDAATLRRTMPQQIFLVPGFGAQGGGVQDILPCFKPDGSGALITASRSVIYAYEGSSTPGDWQTVVENAAIDFKQQVADGLQRHTAG